MNSTLKAVIDEYIDNVNNACHNLLKGLNAQENLNLKTKRDFFEYRSSVRKMEFDVNGVEYKLHGRGCLALSKELYLDWDFGYRSRWCGVDPWMLSMTLKKNNNPNSEFYEGRALKEACETAVEEGIMFEKNGLYHFSIPSNETFCPDFPKEYDILVVEYFSDAWTIPRNKVIDRFLRKSNKIHNKIYDSDNIYTLRFFRENKEIYSIPYDDICYPENAIRIMSDDILWNLRKKPL